MEPIRYLQPATFPPPALQHNSKEIYWKRKYSDSNSNKSSCTSSSKHNETITQIMRRSTLLQQQNILMLSLMIGILLSLVQAIQTTPVFVDNPSLATFQMGRNIRHLPCVVRKSGLSGTCMFAIDCIKQNGTHLGTCIDRFYFGSCCQIKDEQNLIATEISDNSIDQNTISHFVHESTTLPTSALYKPTTFSNQQTIISNNNSTSFKTALQTHTNKTTTTKTATTTSHTTMHPSRPSNITTTSNTIETKRPEIITTHRPTQFVVRTTKRKTTTTTKKPTTTTTTTAPATRKPTTSTRITTTQKTHKPSRRKTTTTTPPAPILTTDGPKIQFSTIEDSLETTTTPPKLFTFQIVETTTATITEPTDFVDFTTTNPPTHHTKRPHRPTNHSKPIENKTSAVTSIITTIETSTTKARPSPPIRNTHKPKPTSATTLSTRNPSATKKPSTKRPKPSPKPAQSTLLTTSTERVKPSIVISSTTKPTKPLADEIPLPTIMHKKPITATTSAHIHTTHAPSTKPRPTANIEKVTRPILTTTTTTASTNTNKTTTASTSKITTASTTKPTTSHKKTTPTSSTKTSTQTAKPKPPTTLLTTTTKITEATAATIPPTTTPITTTTTFKPGLITWTNEEAEPGTNATLVDKWEPQSQHPAQWLPVSTIAPETPSNKSESTNTATIVTTKKPAAPTPSSSTEKIIVSVATSISEAQRNETIKPPKVTTTTTTKSTTTTTRPTTTRKTTTTRKPTTTSKPTTTAQPNLTATTSNPTDMDSTTVDYESSIETSTEGNWGTTATGSTTTVDGITEDYNSSTISPTATTYPPNTLEGMDYRQICGRRMFPEPRIVGGSNAAFGRWPWQISLRQWRTSTYLHKCGAALLNENWAITAAHCVDNVSPADLLLRLGEYDLAEEEEPYGYQERRVQLVASHPQFDPRTFEYDLALLRFYEPVIFQPNIIPVCVPNSDEDFIGQTAFVTGWGRLYEDGPLPSVLQEVAVPVINNTICETMYRAAGYIEHIPHIFICAGWKKGGYDSCEGDSGGPMVIQREDDKRFQLGGVISWGIGCAEANQPGVYTRISEFRDWINQILQY